jgi:PAS domain S-box-containing protein
MENSHQFETIFNHANEAILVVDADGKVKRVNPAFERLFGYAVSEIYNQPFDILIPSNCRKSHEQHVKNYHDNPRPRSMGANLDLFATKKDGREFPVEVSLSPCIIDGEDVVVAFIIDITIRKEAEIQARNYQDQLEKEVEDRTLILKEAISNLENTKRKLDVSLQRERELNTMKTKFISTASHEFRTPLATALSSLSLIEKYEDNEHIEKRNKHIHRVKKSIRTLTEILDDLLTANRLEEGKVHVNPHYFDLKDYLKDMISEIRVIAKDGQEIKLHIESNSDLRLKQDPKILRHIVLNLLSNAIKFSDPQKHIEVYVKNKQNKVDIQITDFGIGIPERDQTNLFTRFFRAENAGQIQGTGLGLAIVKQYAELLQGTVSCLSKENEGSSFTVTIPKVLND